MNNLIIKFNGESYVAKYNEQTEYYELELKAPEIGGVYQADIEYKDVIGDLANDYKDIQILSKKRVEIHTNKTFMWIFSYIDFSVKACIEIEDYEINMDEETNATSLFVILKKLTTSSRDIIAIKKDNEVVYWGTIAEVSKENDRYEYSTKYFTNMFDRFIKLENGDLIRTTGVEDFIANAIRKNFTENADALINIPYLDIEVKTHTKKETSVTNVEHGIYNLHTWMTNCTQNYDIVYNSSNLKKEIESYINENFSAGEKSAIAARDLSAVTIKENENVNWWENNYQTVD